MMRETKIKREFVIRDDTAKEVVDEALLESELSKWIKVKVPLAECDRIARWARNALPGDCISVQSVDCSVICVAQNQQARKVIRITPEPFDVTVEANATDDHIQDYLDNLAEHPNLGGSAWTIVKWIDAA